MKDLMLITAQCGNGRGGGLAFLIAMVICVLMVVAMWRVFTKAGQPGWGCLIPFYNVYLMLKIAGKPGWWLVFFFIPVINLVVQIVMMIDIARNFGRGGWFAAGLIFLPIIFFPILAFGESVYIGAGQPAGG